MITGYKGERMKVIAKGLIDEQKRKTSLKSRDEKGNSQRKTRAACTTERIFHNYYLPCLRNISLAASPQ